MLPLNRTPLTTRERRLGKRLVSRGERELFDSLLQFRGATLSDRLHLGRLFAVGGEGAIFQVLDTAAPTERLVGKIPLATWHKPIHLTSKILRAKRKVIEDEEALLRTAGSRFLPESHGLFHVPNPNLEVARGGAFSEPEPCMVMERLGGQDLDTWLCRVHRGSVDKTILKKTLDRLVVGVIQSLVDLENRGFLYADLRPGNLRVVGRPQRRVRLLDAGGCVPVGADGSRFPHVPSYLPPHLFRDQAKDGIAPSPAVQAVMAGRTLYEVATGQTPKAGRHIDMVRLLRAPVSPAVSEVIAGLAGGDLEHCADALQMLAKRAKRRVRPDQL